MLNTWVNEIPTSMRTPFFNQMNQDKHGPGYDYAASYLYWNNPEYLQDMHSIFMGRSIMQEDKARALPENAISQAFLGRNGFDTAIKNIDPVYSRIVRENAGAIYLAEGGGIKSDGITLTDTDLYKQSVRRAIGGRKGNPDTGIVTFNNPDFPTILPSNVTKQEFSSWVTRLTPAKLLNAADNKLPYTRFGPLEQPISNIIDHGTFVFRSPYHYAIIMSTDNNPLVTRTGKEFIVTIYPHMVQGK